MPTLSPTPRTTVSRETTVPSPIVGGSCRFSGRLLAHLGDVIREG